MKVTLAGDMIVMRDRQVIAANRIYHREDFNYHVNTYIANRSIVNSKTLPLIDWYTEDACKLFRMMNYKELIQSDLNDAAHQKGYHIILHCDLIDINPFNLSIDTNNRHYYYIDRVVDLTVVQDSKLCEVMSI